MLWDVAAAHTLLCRRKVLQMGTRNLANWTIFIQACFNFHSLDISCSGQPRCQLPRSAIYVSVSLYLQIVVRRSSQSLRRDVQRSPAAGMGEMYTRRHSFIIFEMRRMIFCHDSNVIRKYMSGPTAMVRRLYFSRRKDHENSDTLLRVYSISLSHFLLVLQVWEVCRLASCVVCKQTGVLASFISGSVPGLPWCRFRTAYIVVRLLTQGEHTDILCSTADILFASGISHQFEMKIEKQERVRFILWWVLMGGNRSDETSLIKVISISFNVRCLKGLKVASRRTLFELADQ